MRKPVVSKKGSNMTKKLSKIKQQQIGAKARERTISYMFTRHKTEKTIDEAYYNFIRSSVMLCDLFNAEVSEDISELRASASWFTEMYLRELKKEEDRADWVELRRSYYCSEGEFLMYPKETSGELNKPGNLS